MKRLPVLIAWMLASIAFTATAEDESESSLRPLDFAYASELTPGSTNALQTVLVPVEVYRGALRKNLADIRVFAPSGVEVPHAIRTLEAQVPGHRPLVRPPIFPIEEVLGDSDVNEVGIRIERDSEGEIIDIRSSISDDDGDAERSRRMVSYILDARSVDQPIVKLSVDIEGADGDFVFPVQLEASDDLERWSLVLTGDPLVRLDFQGNRIEHRDLDFAPTTAKYFRLSWGDRTLPAPITSVSATTQPTPEPPARVSLELAGEPIDDEAGAYRFDAGGFIPADGIRVFLPEVNTLVKAMLASSDSEDGPWEYVHGGSLYRIVESGQEIQQPEQEIGRRAPRFWRLEITAGQKEFSPDSPSLILSFVPDQLLFVSRDADEHMLSYGSYKALPTEFDPSDLVELAPSAAEAPLPNATATLGPEQVVGGAAALTEPPPPAPIRTYVLWAVLILGATLLGALAIRLLQQQT